MDLHRPITWTAPREGHDWTCPDTLRALTWLRSVADTSALNARLDAARVFYENRREAVEDGLEVDLFDPRDAFAWHVLQAESYATDRRYLVPHAAARTVPYLSRLGQLHDRLVAIDGVEERLARLVNGEMSQPEGPIYELLVAGAWAAQGWRVRFVPEQRGGARTQDLEADRGRASWAIEAKRMMPSAYAAREAEAGRRIAAGLHDLSEDRGHSVIVTVNYERELKTYAENVLAEAVRELLPVRAPRRLDLDGLQLFIRPVDWSACRTVFARDFVYIGSTRMMELVCGFPYDHDLAHDMRARCRRWTDHPSYADHIYHASLVRWVCSAPESRNAKAKHFRKKISDGEGQLPDDRPGVIHIGMEGSGHLRADMVRHIRNGSAAYDFERSQSRLRWIHGNYFKPEATTRPDESLAMEETVAWYKVGRHSTRNPLPDQLLLADDGNDRPGAFWD